MQCFRVPIAVAEPFREEFVEDTLVREARSGDRIALARLLAPHQGSLFSLCLDVLGHAQDAEDAVQETYLRALNGLSQFRGDSSVRTWLFRIAVRVCLDGKRARRPSVPLDEDLISAERCPELTALDRSWIDNILSSLMPRHRAILLLKEWQGFSTAEIAAVMGWKVRKVHNELYQVRKVIAELLEREGDIP